MSAGRGQGCPYHLLSTRNLYFIQSKDKFPHVNECSIRVKLLKTHCRTIYRDVDKDSRGQKRSRQFSCFWYKLFD